MRNITAVICLDDDGGVSFNKRRQSSDRLLVDELIRSTDGDIYISEYSLPLFSEHSDRVRVCTSPLDDCPDGGVCFVERTDPTPWLVDVGTLVIYRWNRRYPRDISFKTENARGFTLSGASEFVGNSHKLITKEVYRK